MISDFAALLRQAGREVTDEELADLCWLAVQMERISSQIARTETSVEAEQMPEVVERPTEELPNAIPTPSETHQQPSPTLLSDGGNVHPASSARLSQQEMKAVPIKSPAAPLLANTLGIGQALRPLMRRVPSQRHTLLDEEATAEMIATQGIWLPVLKPAPERWLSVSLVVDDSPSMVIWSTFISYLELLLQRQGAFRDVHRWSLLTDMDGEHVRMLPGKAGATERASGRKLEELVDATGRNLLLFVSDCVSPAWSHGTMSAILSKLGQQNAVTVLQILPRRLWSRSALGDAVPGTLKAWEPAPPNSALHFVPSNYLIDREDLPGWLPLPVVSLEQEILANWAQMLVGKSQQSAAGYMLDPFRHTRHATESDQRRVAPLMPDQRVKRFRATATQPARKLVGLLAAAAPINVQVIRLLQQTMLSPSEQEQGYIAEVLLGGLLEQLPMPGETMQPEYDFAAGVRELLLNAMPTNTSLDVLNHVSAYMETRFGQPLDFDTLLEHPQAASRMIPVHSKPFLRVTAKVLRRLGGSYASLARQLEEALEIEAQRDTDEAIKGDALLTEGRSDSSDDPRVARIATMIAARQKLASELGAQRQEILHAIEALPLLKERMEQMGQRKLAKVPAKDEGSLDSAVFTLYAELEKLARLERRLGKGTFNIGTFGEMGQGKSRCLQSLGGLSEEFVFTGNQGMTTGACCIFYHTDAKPYAEVIPYTEEAFLAERVHPYYQQLSLQPLPRSAKDFADQHLVRPQFSMDRSSRLRQTFEYLQNLQRHFADYAPLLQLSPSRIPIEECRNYITAETRGGLQRQFQFYGVRTVNLYCPFPLKATEQIALVDGPALGDRIDANDTFIARILDDVDVALMLWTPDARHHRISDTELRIYDLIKSVASPNHRLFCVLNRFKGSIWDDRDDYQDMQLKTSTILGDASNALFVDTMIADCSDSQETQEQVLDRVIDYCADNMAELDWSTIESALATVHQLRQEAERQVMLFQQQGLASASTRENNLIVPLTYPQLKSPAENSRFIAPRINCPFCNYEFRLNEAAIVSTVNPGKVLRPGRPSVFSTFISRMPALDGPNYAEEMAVYQCPRCWFSLPYRYESSTNITIGIIGDTLSGKTHYLAALLSLLEEGAMLANFSRVQARFIPQTAYTTNILGDYRQVFEDQEAFQLTRPFVLDPTKTIPVWKPLIFRMLIRSTQHAQESRSVNLVFYDLAGEDIGDEMRLAQYGWPILQAHALIYLADLLSIKSVINGLPSNKKPRADLLPIYAQRSSNEVLDNVIDTLRRFRRLPPVAPLTTPFAIALSKSDILDGIIPRNHAAFLEPSQYDGSIPVGRFRRDHEAIRAWLSSVNESGLLRSAEYLTNSSFFAVSATGSSANAMGKFAFEMRPRRCLDPLLWILWRLAEGVY